MKPLNYDNSPCSPISSNCVIWQGPDLHCIKLCAGDTVSDVVANLATELCTIMEQLDITNYDLSCFNLVSCPPNTFEALIQFLIEKICSLEGISNDPNSGNKSSTGTGCPDCLVSVASCFIVNNITSMQLIDYVNMIGQRVCNILTTITELQDQISELDVRVTILENATAPIFTMPTILVACTIQTVSSSPLANINIVNGGAATAIDLVLSGLINDPIYGYCALRTALGLPAALQTAVASQCITSSSTSLVYGTPMATAYVGSWIGTPTTIADTLTDMWISICDIFEYLSTMLTITAVAAGENTTVTSATVGSTTTYTVNSTGLNSFIAHLTIDQNYQPLDGSIPLVAPSSVIGLTAGQIINRYNKITVNNTNVTATATAGSYVSNGSIPTCPFGTFDNATTGEFSITRTGMYLIQGSCNLKADASSSSYWQTTGSGSFGIGLLSNSNDIFGGQYLSTIASINKNINQCADVLTYIVASSGSPVIVRLSVLNLTDRSYNGNGYAGSDNIRFSITQVK